MNAQTQRRGCVVGTCLIADSTFPPGILTLLSSLVVVAFSFCSYSSVHPRQLFQLQSALARNARMSLFSRFSVASLLIAMAAASGETCYYPDGETVSTDIACDSGTTYSSCCPSDSFCLSNGLCSTGGITTRASCTDKTWASDECASVCTNSE